MSTLIVVLVQYAVLAGLVVLARRDRFSGLAPVDRPHAEVVGPAGGRRPAPAHVIPAGAAS